MKQFNDKEYTLYKQLTFLNESKLKTILFNTLKMAKYEPVEKENYILAKGDIPIALCAHLDTVFPKPPTEDNILYDREKNIIISTCGLGADDRAGIYAIIDIIKSGLKPYIILTCGEERGGIGAIDIATYNEYSFFKNIKFIIELDRQGLDDCVFYDCDNRDFIKYIESFGFKEKKGTFSDISFICPSYEIAGVNLSIGYFNEHTVRETLYVSALKETIEKVKNILKDNNSKKFKYIFGDRNFYNNFYNWKTGYNKKYKCYKCGKEFLLEEELIPIKKINGEMSFICPDCIGNSMIDFCQECGTVFEKEFKNDIYCKDCRLIKKEE